MLERSPLAAHPHIQRQGSHNLMMNDLLTVLSLSLDSLRSHFVVIFSDSHCCNFVVSHCSVSGFLGLIASFFNYNIRILRIGVNSFLRIFYGAEFSAQRCALPARGGLSRVRVQARVGLVNRAKPNFHQ